MRAYITVLSTPTYIPGVVVLYKSLKKTKTKYPFYVLINSSINECDIEYLKEFGINVIKSNNKELLIPSKIRFSNRENGYNQWNHTFDKLHIFQLDQFKKLVYIDSDMLILNNIDELFEKPHMSAVVAGALRPENSHWKLLNSGLMVIEPQKGLGNKIAHTLSIVQNKKDYFGDQDLIQEYYNKWEFQNDLRLDDKYNLFIFDLEYYVSNLGYRIFGKSNKTISIIHFIGKQKPWMMTRTQKVKTLFYNLRIKNFSTFIIYLRYFHLLINSKKRGGTNEV